MRLMIAAIGRLKADGERELVARYAERIDGLGRAHALGPLKIVEIAESRAQGAAERKAEEAAALLKAAGERGKLVALDERGKPMTSRAFAELIRRERDSGSPDLTFLIGGPDGHGEAVLAQASVKLSLSAMTLPHALARALLAEQIYRAVTILAGHPYHRD
jgi:23S rRNA (pseudouridine1915-N3)-methyltransferase